MNKFELLGLDLLQSNGLWAAKIKVTISDVVDGYTVGQCIIIEPRFKYPNGGSVEGLLEAALDVARRIPNAAADYLSHRSAVDLVAEGDDAPDFEMPS